MTQFSQFYDGTRPDDMESFDFESETEWRRFFIKYFVPVYQSAHPRSQEQMKLTFKIHLNLPDGCMARYLLSWAPEVESPIFSEILNKKLFVWLWEVLFPGESYKMDDAAEYVNVKDGQVECFDYDEKTYKSE